MRRIQFYSRIVFFLIAVASHSSGQVIGSLEKSFGEQIRRDSVFSFKSSKGYFPSLIHNLGRQATFPLRMDRCDLIWLGATAASTLTLIHYDQRVDDRFKTVKDDNRFIKWISPELTELGDYYGYALLAGYGGYSIIFKKYKAFRTSLLASQAAITAGLWIRLGKILSCRMRPGATYNDDEFKKDHWFGPFAVFDSKYDRGVPSFDAFPSGHTGAAFAMATVISRQYRNQRAIPITMYSLAGIVGITRMIEHEHWASDVLLGGVIGYLCGRQVVDNEIRLFPEGHSYGWKLRSNFFPYYNDGISGVTLILSAD